jgi:hypothetical protein
MMKLDLKRNLRHLYNPSPREAEVIDVPAMAFLMIDGAGDPNTSSSYQDAVSALYSLSYTLKFMLKKGPEAIDYPVMPLEGLWWTDDPRQFSLDRKNDWNWTLMIVQPEFVTASHVARAAEEARRKKDLPALPLVRHESYHEGLSAQIMHLGPYAAEPPTIQKLHAFIRQRGCAMRGKHHEIYLGDPIRTAPERLKTIIRQPVR